VRRRHDRQRARYLTLGWMRAKLLLVAALVGYTAGVTS